MKVLITLCSEYMALNKLYSQETAIIYIFYWRIKLSTSKEFTTRILKFILQLLTLHILISCHLNIKYFKTWKWLLILNWQAF